MSVDRRKHPRVPMEAVTGVLNCPSPSRGVDISQGGIRFYCAGLGAKVGGTLTVELVLQGDSFLVTGTVVRVTDLAPPAQDVSLAFTDLDPEAARLLQEVLPTDES